LLRLSPRAGWGARTVYLRRRLRREVSEETFAWGCFPGVALEKAGFWVGHGPRRSNRRRGGGTPELRVNYLMQCPPWLYESDEVDFVVLEGQSLVGHNRILCSEEEDVEQAQDE